MKTQLEHWRVLDAVITCGGVSQAAKALFRTQSAISYSLKQLEEQAGVELLVLLGRKLHLTPAGQQLLQEARQILQRMHLLDEKTTLLSQGIESSITIAIEQIAPMEPILKAIESVQAIYPHINLHWHELILSEVDSAFHQYNADLIVATHIPLNHTGKEWRKVDLIGVVSKHHSLATAQSIELNQLSEYTQVVVRDKGKGDKDAGWLGSPKRYTVDHIHTAQQMVHAGMAYAWLPEHVIEQPIQNGQLVKLALTEGDVQEIRLKIIMNPSKSRGEVVTSLRDHLMKMIENQK
jgi:DNA-binding transcriptional LysR family regulator